MSKSAKKIPLAKEPQGKDAGSLLSAWSPLRESVFRALWIATVVSNIGTWMQDVGESWLMTSLTPLVSLVLSNSRHQTDTKKLFEYLAADATGWNGGHHQVHESLQLLFR